jgi:hypothetical protein
MTAAFSFALNAGHQPKRDDRLNEDNSRVQMSAGSHYPIDADIALPASFERALPCRSP